MHFNFEIACSSSFIEAAIFFSRVPVPCLFESEPLEKHYRLQMQAGNYLQQNKILMHFTSLYTANVTSDDVNIGDFNRRYQNMSYR